MLPTPMCHSDFIMLKYRKSSMEADRPDKGETSAAREELYNYDSYKLIQRYIAAYRHVTT